MLHFDKLSASDKLSTASKPGGLRKCFLEQKMLGFDTLFRWRYRVTQPALVPQPVEGFRRRVLARVLERRNKQGTCAVHLWVFVIGRRS